MDMSKFLGGCRRNPPERTRSRVAAGAVSVQRLRGAAAAGGRGMGIGGGGGGVAPKRIPAPTPPSPSGGAPTNSLPQCPVVCAPGALPRAAGGAPGTLRRRQVTLPQPRFAAHRIRCNEINWIMKPSQTFVQCSESSSEDNKVEEEEHQSESSYSGLVSCAASPNPSPPSSSTTALDPEIKVTRLLLKALSSNPVQKPLESVPSPISTAQSSVSWSSSSSSISSQRATKPGRGCRLGKAIKLTSTVIKIMPGEKEEEEELVDREQVPLQLQTKLQSVFHNNKERILQLDMNAPLMQYLNQPEKVPNPIPNPWLPSQEVLEDLIKSRDPSVFLLSLPKSNPIPPENSRDSWVTQSREQQPKAQQPREQQQPKEQEQPRVHQQPKEQQQPKKIPMIHQRNPAPQYTNPRPTPTRTTVREQPRKSPNQSAKSPKNQPKEASGSPYLDNWKPTPRNWDPVTGFPVKSVSLNRPPPRPATSSHTTRPAGPPVGPPAPPAAPAPPARTPLGSPSSAGKIVRKAQHLVPRTMEDGIDMSYQYFVSIPLKRGRKPQVVRYLYRPMVRNLNGPNPHSRSSGKRAKRKQLKKEQELQQLGESGDVLGSPKDDPDLLALGGIPLPLEDPPEESEVVVEEAPRSLHFTKPEDELNAPYEEPPLKLPSRFLPLMKELAQMPYPDDRILRRRRQRRLRGRAAGGAEQRPSPELDVLPEEAAESLGASLGAALVGALGGALVGGGGGCGTRSGSGDTLGSAARRSRARLPLERRVSLVNYRPDAMRLVTSSGTPLTYHTPFHFTLGAKPADWGEEVEEDESSLIRAVTYEDIERERYEEEQRKKQEEQQRKREEKLRKQQEEQQKRMEKEQQKQELQLKKKQEEEQQRREKGEQQSREKEKQEEVDTLYLHPEGKTVSFLLPSRSSKSQISESTTSNSTSSNSTFNSNSNNCSHNSSNSTSKSNSTRRSSSTSNSQEAKTRRATRKSKAKAKAKGKPRSKARR
ncbi:hypothetical protein KR009_001486 [Drosophila setifemur]|nr:hypothetical protein KR009_001486 [Drosophila setifemur]